MKNRPRVAKVSEQMKAWSAMLGQELEKWPAVTSRRMFGMTVFYRDKHIFAALPRTLSFETPNSVAFKLYKTNARTTKLLRSDPSITAPTDCEKGWIAFEIHDTVKLSSALPEAGRKPRGYIFAFSVKIQPCLCSHLPFGDRGIVWCPDRLSDTERHIMWIPILREMSTRVPFAPTADKIFPNHHGVIDTRGNRIFVEDIFPNRQHPLTGSIA